MNNLKQKAWKLYQDLGSLRAVGEEIGVSHETIRTWLDDFGVSHSKNRPTLDRLELMYAKTLADNKISQREIAGILDKSCYVVSNSLKGYYRKYSIDEDFFSDIDTEAKGYWLGYILADGNIHKNQLSICSIDRDHLELLRECIQSTYPLSNQRGVPVFQVTNSAIVKSLEELGITPRKGKTAKPIQSIPTGLIRHYQRGIFDGDGCIHPKRNCINLAGTQAICDDFSSFLGYNGKYIYHHSSGTYYFQIGNSVDRCRYILDKLYKNATIYLDRKYEIYRKFYSKQLNLLEGGL